MPAKVTQRALAIGYVRHLNDSSDDHTLGVARLLDGDVDRAIRTLESVARASGDANTLNDLAAAFLTRADREHSMLAAIDALGVADRAVALDPRNAAATCNRALALEDLSLLREARAEWVKARDLEAGSQWASESVAAIRRLTKRLRPIGEWPKERPRLEAAARSGAESDVRAIVDAYPHDSRAWAETVYPAQWAEAWLRHDPTAAEASLVVSRAVGRALRLRSDERLLSEAVAAIDGGSNERRDVLAAAYMAYRSGRVEHQGGFSVRAETHLREAERLFSAGASPMRLVTRYYVASTLYARDAVRESASLLDELASRNLADRGYRALAAEIGWERGLSHLVRGSFGTALAIFDVSSWTFHALGEDSMAAAIEEFEADTYDFAGDGERAWSARKGALETFARDGNEERIMNAIATSTRAMISRREWQRGLPLLDLTITSAVARKDATLAAEALGQRSTIRMELGDRAGGSSDLAEMRRWCAALPDDASSRPLQAQLALVEGLTAAHSDVVAAIGHFDRARSLLESSGRSYFVAQVLLERARARRREGMEEEARHDIEEGVRLIETERRMLVDPEQRALAFSAAEALVTEGVALALSRTQAAYAFDLMERGRARSLMDYAARRGGQPRSFPSTAETMRTVLAPRAAIVEYWVLSAGVAVVVLTPAECRGVELSVQPETIDRAVAAHDTDALFRLLIQPISGVISEIDALAIVPGHRLGDVPFDLLRDPVTQRLLIDDHSVVIAPSATFAIQCASRARHARRGTVLAVSGDAFDRRVTADADQLSRAPAEAQRIAATYPRGVSVSGQDATNRRLRVEFSRASVIHFAGHAVIDPHHPLDSALLVAPDSENGTLTAGEIVSLDLSGSSLVFLSSCSTARGGTRGDGVENLATAFLAAGAPTVVGATSAVRDEDAANFAVAFHREYAATHDAALAFRNALHQERIHDPDITHRIALGLYGGLPSLVKSKG